MKTINCLIIFSILAFMGSFADVPSTFSYQGILTDSLGESVEYNIG
jgi:hypothetical protein